jgi:ribonuclease P protein component
MSEFAFPQEHHIRTKAEFKRILENGKKVKAHKCCYYILENGLAHSRLGFIITTKIGNAPTRNKIKRLWKEAFRLERVNFQMQNDFILRFFPGYQCPQISEIRKELLELEC